MGSSLRKAILFACVAIPALAAGNLAANAQTASTAEADMLVKIGYGVDEGTTEVSVDPFARSRYYSPFYRGYYSPFYGGYFGRPYWSRYGYYGYRCPPYAAYGYRYRPYGYYGYSGYRPYYGYRGYYGNRGYLARRAYRRWR